MSRNAVGEVTQKGACGQLKKKCQRDVILNYRDVKLDI